MTLQVLYWQSMVLHCRHRSCFSFFRQQPTSFLVPGPLPTRPLSLSSAQGLPWSLAQTWYPCARVSVQPAHGSCSAASEKTAAKTSFVADAMARAVAFLEHWWAKA